MGKCVPETRATLNAGSTMMTSLIRSILGSLLRSIVYYSLIRFRPVRPTKKTGSQPEDPPIL